MPGSWMGGKATKLRGFFARDPGSEGELHEFNLFTPSPGWLTALETAPLIKPAPLWGRVESQQIGDKTGPEPGVIMRSYKSTKKILDFWQINAHK